MTFRSASSFITTARDGTCGTLGANAAPLKVSEVSVEDYKPAGSNSQPRPLSNNRPFQEMFSGNPPLPSARHT
jgi:hypothetical protein